MTVTGFMHGAKAESPVQRFDVFTGAGRHRDWSDEEGTDCRREHGDEISISAVAQRHGLSPGQLFTRRRQLRKQPEPDLPPMSVQAVIEAVSDERRNPCKRSVKVTAPPAAVELEIDGVILKIGSGANAAMMSLSSGP